MKINPSIRKWTIVAGVVVASALFGWIAVNYVDPKVEAAFAFNGDVIAIENQNRMGWRNPVFILDDGAELRIEGVWPPGEQRSFHLRDFRHLFGGYPHDPGAKKGFTITVQIPGFTTTLFYNWD
jgi:hypothetical protein